MKNQKELAPTIKDVLEVCNERKEGYEKAAEKVKDSFLKATFEKYAQQSAKFSKELEPFSDKSSSEVGTRIIADTWRMWIALKAALTDGGREALIEACITGEESAIKNYEEALEDGDLPNNVRNIIEKQLLAIKSALQDIKMKK